MYIVSNCLQVSICILNLTATIKYFEINLLKIVKIKKTQIKKYIVTFTMGHNTVIPSEAGISGAVPRTLLDHH